jgi:D-galactarolactone isomerase
VRESLKRACAARGLDTDTLLLCDTHSHIYPDTAPPSARAALADYRALADDVGLRRHVVVHSKAHRDDVASVTDAIERLGGPACARGVLWEDPQWSHDDLARLHAAGIRGVRTLHPPGTAPDLAALQATASKIAPLGWHLLVQAECADWAPHADALCALPCPVVLDHLGRLPPDTRPDDPTFLALLRFLRGGGWIKISAPYYGTVGGLPSFAPMGWRVRALLDAAPSRALWGLNWPHVNLRPDQRPDDVETLESLVSLFTSTAEARAVLSDNAARLYGFSDAGGSAQSAV